MKNCLTKPLVFKEVSGCLLEKPECGFAYNLGFSILCRHPEHSQFHAHLTGAMTEMEIRQLYDALREKRRDEFMASLDEESRRYFCHKSDFHGRPLANLDNSR